jgi:zinc protease
MKLILCCTLITALFVSPAFAQDTKKTERVLDIQEVVSESGIKAWLVEDHSLPIIAMEFAFQEAGSARDPKDKQGLARMASNTMDEGAGDLDSQAFQKTLTDLSISLSFSAGRDDFSGSLKALTRHKDKAFELMHLALARPRFDQEAVSRMRDANIARVKSSMAEPDWMAARLLNDRAYAGHEYALNSGGTLTSLTAITREDLENFAKTNLTRDRLVIGVAGDMTAAELKTTMDKIFSGLPASATAQPLSDLDIDGKNAVVLYEQDIPQTIIEIMMPGMRRTDPDFFAAQIMNFTLGGSGFGSRLTEEIREKRGLTYGIQSSLQEMDHTTGYGISLSTENKNAGEALRLIQAEMKKISDAAITDDELKAAQSYMIGSLPLAFTSTEAIASTLAGLQKNDRPIDYLDQLPNHLNAVTKADVQRAARRLLQPQKSLTILVGKPVGVTATETATTLPNVE